LTPKESVLLEDYLYELEGYLSKLPPSKRAKYIADNHTHICETLEKDSHKALKEILSDLGEPRLLANHILLDHGMETFSPKKKISLGKWIFISILSSTALFFISLAILVWSFTPIFKVDEKSNRVMMFGGLIDVNGTSGRIKVGNQYHFVQNKFTHSFDGSMEINKNQVDEVVINFKSGVLDISTSLDNKLSWNCKLGSEPNNEIVNIGNEIIEIDLQKTGGHSCDIAIPNEMKVTIDGEDGQLALNEVEFDTYVDMDNGQVVIAPNPEFDYKYDFTLQNGMADKLESTESPDAYEVRVYLKNGSIKRP
jgi:hypothetical protein